MLCQKKSWFQTWAALLKTAVWSSLPAVSATMPFEAVAIGVPATSLLRLLT